MSLILDGTNGITLPTNDGKLVGVATIHNADSKITPSDNDEFAILDSATTFSLKKLTFANLKATLKTYFDTLYDLSTVWVANDSRAKTALNASGNAPIYACRAWVNFNGTGTVAIRASGNVSSITDNGLGDYTVNFTTAMIDSNYSLSYCGGITYQYGDSDPIADITELSTSWMRVTVSNTDSGAPKDYTINTFAIFR